MALALKEIPGSYGLPLIGPAADRAEFSGPAGQESYVRKRVDNYKSTVFRANMPPGPPGFPDSSAIFLADQSSFQILFDIAQVQKTDVLGGSFMPSTDYTGGFRVLAYLDPIQDKDRHFKLKKFCFKILSSNAQKWLPGFETAINEAFPGWEENVQNLGTSVFTTGFMFNCLTRVVLNNASMGDEGPTNVKIWLMSQIAPVASALVAAPIPFNLVELQYKKITEFFRSNGTEVLDMAQNEFGIDREEALHNLIFFLCFNAYGGLDSLFQSLLKYIGNAGESLQQKLREEIRAAVKEAGGKITMGALDNSPLLKSAVYEVLRIDPPAKKQCGRARMDLIISSHTARFKVKRGELLVGYQPLATKDPVVFEKPEEFIPDRFLGSEGEKLLKYVLWSNGPETENSTTENKQCGGKLLVPMFGRLFIAHMFLRYDSFAIESYGLGTGQEVLPRFTKLVKATS